MGGALYVLAEILLFLGLAAVIGFVIGRLTVGKREPSGPLKRLSEVETSSCPPRRTCLTRQATCAADSVLPIRRSANSKRATSISGKPPRPPAPHQTRLPKTMSLTRSLLQLRARRKRRRLLREPTTSIGRLPGQTKAQQGGPAELIRAAKAAKQGETGPIAGLSSPSEAMPERDAKDG